MINVKNLKKSFEKNRVLKGVSISVDEGKVLSIIGSSGTGKSTFIKCIIGLLKPDSGEIIVDDKDITQISDDYELMELRKNFGYLFQEGALFDSMSVGENVAFGLKYLTKVPKSEYKKIVAEKLALVGLVGIENMRPSELSGGMKKRVSLARVLAPSPKYILYDEPTSGLDPIRADSIGYLILDLKKKLNVTSIVITHDMSLAYKVSDKIAMLCGGNLVLHGTPKEFKTTKNAMVRQFVDGKREGPIKLVPTGIKTEGDDNI
ncbi:MAG: ATP-binding cassette domain-containing protein [Elusimicrobiaceae bacterium]|jgi:phospholipid/cholesterol/gamma-HCH transport system ATP-binding protein|nr:ATP-binding cassette domain-containing protein [Elusimicrobiaceae bacterium]MBT3955343.1 ATP-binding cassette domain-containing protein [Elusimicrobiaceae bacterium]MBT4008479.1 ATP-binding cassette domain-containing protein [Elusimicrobiaceae bacterium]MBT4403367.1 ATP-binding cassette domain-containing protein [Elusimicrobiaceae bacterium]MBT4440208.1 ATP-binding cassette domain-containing protein [Elusimicrobiaceae bacterium]